MSVALFHGLVQDRCPGQVSPLSRSCLQSNGTGFLVLNDSSCVFVQISQVPEKAKGSIYSAFPSKVTLVRHARTLKQPNSVSHTNFQRIRGQREPLVD